MSPIAGIVDAQNLRRSHGGHGGFSGHFGLPVVFNTASLVNEGLVCTDGAYFSFNGWFKTDWSVGGEVAWVVDPDGSYNSFLGQGSPTPFFAIGNNPDDGYAKTFLAPAPNAHWHHLIGTARGDIAGGQKFKFYESGVDRTGSPITNANSIIPPSNGLPFFVGSDDGAYFIGEMSDLSIWPGVSFFNAGETDIDPHILAAFRDPVHGIPVDPLVAIALLGTPAIMLTGNASEFPSNALGSGGPFTVMTGTLTDGVDVVMD